MSIRGQAESAVTIGTIDDALTRDECGAMTKRKALSFDQSIEQSLVKPTIMADQFF